MSQPFDATSLLQGAVASGDISPQSLQALTNFGMVNQIHTGLGTPFDSVDATESIVIAQLVDDSGSIRFAGNADAVRQGHNMVLDALDKSKQRDGILAFTALFNAGVISPFTPLAQALRLDTHNFNPMGGTPLYAQSLAMLGTVAAKLEDAARNGMNCRAVALIASDGADTDSGHVRARDVAVMANKLLLSEKCVILAMGFDDGATDFHAVFRSMGVPDDSILTVSNTPSEIRRAFLLASQSAVRASQAAAGPGFSQSVGGFAQSASTP